MMPLYVVALCFETFAALMISNGGFFHKGAGSPLKDKYYQLLSLSTWISWISWISWIVIVAGFMIDS